MKPLLICYPKCSTCQKAKRFLEEQGIEFQQRHIVEQCPTAEELKAWWQASGLPLKRFFNTSGLKYKALKLKEKLPEMSEEEQLALLSTDGMLIKRPILVTDTDVLVGFKPAEWETKGQALKR
ncbi:MAG: arsenate reductase family protein [Christensenellales bacterium]|jgi:arsenate reductase